MKKKYLIYCLVFFSLGVSANEPYLANPTSYVLDGEDRYGEDAYTVKLQVVNSESKSKAVYLRVRIYNQYVDVSNRVLKGLIDPDISGVWVVNDVGIFGSFFRINIPYGDVRSCKKAEKKMLKPYLTVHSYDVESSGKLSVELHDPCKKP